MALWQYSDWITQTDNATRLTRLRLHIQEVSEQVIGTDVLDTKVEAIDQEYLKRLYDEEKRLREVLSRSSKSGRNRAKFTG